MAIYMRYVLLLLVLVNSVNLIGCENNMKENKMKKKDLDFIDSTGAEYSLDSTDYVFPEDPPKIIELTLRSQADAVLEKLRPFDGLKILVAGYDSDLSSAGLKFLCQAKDLKDVSLMRCDLKRLPPEAFTHLASVPNLEQLLLIYSGDGDEVIRRIAKAKKLRILYLCQHFTDQGLVYLKRLEQLEELNLSDTLVTNAGMKHISCLSGLKTLSIGGIPVNYDGLLEIAKMSQLETLALSYSDTVGKRIRLRKVKITDRDIEALRGFEGLRVLDLSGTRVSDKSMQWIGSLPKLEKLYLEKTRITDDGIIHLFKAPSLVYIDVNDTHVTEKMVRELLKNLPATEARAELNECIFKKSNGAITVTSYDEIWENAEKEVSSK